MDIKHILGITALAISSHAGAAVTDWGQHDPLEQYVGAVGPGSFTDLINFSLTDDTPLAVSIVANNLTDKLDIIGGSISLFEKTDNGLNLALGSYEFSGATGDTTRLFTPRGPGDYMYAITGYATGTQGGWYAVAATALVPEPDAPALAVSALLLTSMVYRRRIRR